MKQFTLFQKGAGLIEVLVTALLVSTALLTLVALQARSVQYNKSAFFRSQANILSYDIIDRIRLSRAQAANYNIALYDADPQVNNAAAVNPQSDIVDWRNNIKNTLPNGKGAISCNGSNICTVTIQWNEVNSSGDAAEDVSSFVFSTKV